MKKNLRTFSFALLLVACAIRPAMAAPSCVALFDDRVVVRAPLPLEQQPLISKEQAQELISQTAKLQVYSIVQVGLSKNVKLKIVLDAKVEWLTKSVEAFAGKPVAQLDQKTIKAFIESLAASDLRRLLPPSALMYGGVTRSVQRDGGTYYLEELIQSQERKDLAVALIGQALLEIYNKKEVRIVEVLLPGAKDTHFSLLIQNGNPEIIVPGICANAACGAAIVKAADLVVTSSSIASVDKNNKKFSVIDLNGRAHEIAVTGRSATERMVREDQEKFMKAGLDDLVPVEFYHMTAYLAGGTTMFRIGESMFHFGSNGWEHQPGTEGVKGFLVSNPYSRRMFEMFKGFGLPAFNIGVTMMVPKAKAQAILDILKIEVARPEHEKERFNFTKNNCVQVALRMFEKAGLPMGSSAGFQGFSSSLTFRNLVLNSPYPVRSVNVYPMPGIDLTENQYRSFFPGFIYRAYSVRADRNLVHFSGPARDRYRDAVLLEAVAVAEAEGKDTAFERMEKTQLVSNADDMNHLLQNAAEQKLISWTPGAALPLLTDKGKQTLADRSREYDLPAAIPR